MAEYSPMMQHYLQTKEEYPDCILFYRLGDFYEMFFEDAKIVSRELELTLTGKSCGQEERAPMCGVPFHAYESYMNRLVAKGYKVAICEQMEDPKQAKGMVRREVIRVVTPGTNINEQALDEGKNNYIMCIVSLSDQFGVATADVTTGDFFVTEVDSKRRLLDEIYKFSPTEVVCNEALFMSGLDIDDLKNRVGIVGEIYVKYSPLYSLEHWYFDDSLCENTLKEHFRVNSLEGLGLADLECGMIASGSLLKYLYETQKNSLEQISAIHPYTTGKFMVLDSSTRRNLELVETLREKAKRGSLLWVLDKTKTAMGARMLRSFVEQPLIEKEEIEGRLDAIEELMQRAIDREELREYLNPVYDLERLLTRITYQSANPRDLTAFKSSIGMIPHIRRILLELQSKEIQGICEDMDTLEDLYTLIDAAIEEEPPITVREGGIIKDGYHEEIDRLREAKSQGKNWLAELEAKEREKTGIKNLKIKFNKVFGYYLEVTNSFKDLVPDYYTRKQTLTNAERYITPELKEMEDMILGAEDKLVQLEYELFRELREQIAKNVVRIQKTAKALAKIDVFASLALISEQNHYCRPSLNQNGRIDIKNGRHPVVEKMINNDMFIANDTYLDNQKNRISVITGPNMAGKSVYMKQVALITVLAHIGSFVPAKSAEISIVDKLFTRVGASDDLGTGRSTFMVEMSEVSYILSNITDKSLILLDEIGRGTSTYDGLSIAWAIIEYISQNFNAKTLFSTHYHELTELEGILKGVKNYKLTLKEKDGNIVFLRKLMRGSANKSFGIEVAGLAGLPKYVISRAKELLASLEKADIMTVDPPIANQQISLFNNLNNNAEINAILTELDLDEITPRQAMDILADLKEKAVKNNG